MEGAIGGVAAGIGYFIGAGAVATFIATVVVYAVVGAVIGGISAAVMGGDIGKGILFGAIGGAVMGGISGVIGAYTGTSAMAGVETASQGPMNSIAGGAANATTAGNMTSGTFGAGSTGAGLLSGAGNSTGSALVTTGGQMLMKGFDDSGEIAQAEAQKNRDSAKELAQLQADTQIKLEGMRGSGGGSNGDARYSADIQLQNAREERAQARATKNQDIDLLEESRLRRAAAVRGIDIADSSGVDTSGALSINEQAMLDANKAYPTGSPQVLSGGVLANA